MTTSDWITISTVLISLAVACGAIITKFGAFEKELNGFRKEFKKEMHNVSKALTNHHYRIKKLKKVSTKLKRDFYKS
jgi:hypothetical protein